MSTALAALPHLGPDGIRQALAVIDRAMKNVKLAKALDDVFQDVDAGNQPGTARAAARLKEEIGGEQAQLLGLMRQLCKVGGPAPAQAQAADQRAADARVPAVVPTPSWVEQPRSAQVLQLTELLHASSPPTEAAVQQPRKAGRPAGEGTAMAAKPPTQPPPAARMPRAGTSKKARAPAPDEERPQTLTMSLQCLEGADHDSLFIVRHISKLGFKAARTLKKHFSAYGSVEKVLVAFSSSNRPGNLGFIQMGSCEAVSAIFAEGMEQKVEGTVVRLEKFGREQASTIRGDHLESQKGCFERGTSNGSEASLASMSTCAPEDAWL